MWMHIDTCSLVSRLKTVSVEISRPLLSAVCSAEATKNCIKWSTPNSFQQFERLRTSSLRTTSEIKNIHVYAYTRKETCSKNFWKVCLYGVVADL